MSATSDERRREERAGTGKPWLLMMNFRECAMFWAAFQLEKLRQYSELSARRENAVRGSRGVPARSRRVNRAPIACFPNAILHVAGIGAGHHGPSLPPPPLWHPVPAGQDSGCSSSAVVCPGLSSPSTQPAAAKHARVGALTTTALMTVGPANFSLGTSPR